MYILNDSKFTEFLQKLALGEIKQERDNELDLVDYHQFLMLLLEGIEDPSRLEILRNSDARYYSLLEATIDESNISKLQLSLEKVRNDAASEVHSLNIICCREVRLEDDNARQYFVEIDNDDLYSFTLSLQEKCEDIECDALELQNE